MPARRCRDRPTANESMESGMPVGTVATDAGYSKDPGLLRYRPSSVVMSLFPPMNCQVGKRASWPWACFHFSQLRLQVYRLYVADLRLQA